MKIKDFIKKNSSLFKNTIFIIFLLVIIYFFWKTLSRNYEEISKFNYSITYELVLAVFLMILPVFVSGMLWGRLILQITGIKVNKFWSIYVHSIAWLSKYIPGKMGLILSKLAFAEQKGIEKKSVLISSFYENIFLVIASFAISLPFVSVFLLDGENDVYFYLSISAVVSLLALLYKPVLSKVLSVISRYIKMPIDQNTILPTKKQLVNLCLYLVPRVFNAIAFVFIAESLFNISSDMYLVIGASYVFASVMGLLSIFAPGGIGVREAIIAIVLTSIIGAESAIILAIVARFLITVADVAILLFVMAVKFSKIKI